MATGATDISGHAILKARQRAERHTYPAALALRVQRALSWLHRAEAETEDADARFLFLWIAFNAAYATEIPESGRIAEKGRLRHFFDRIARMDSDGRVYEILWNRYTDAVRLLIDNRYVFQPFWSFHGGDESFADWPELFSRSRRQAHKALADKDTARLLTIVFDRLYTLRNQLVHGGATWNSSVNRDQVRDGMHLLDELVPVMVELMMDHPQTLWGTPQYPVVDSGI